MPWMACFFSNKVENVSDNKETRQPNKDPFWPKKKENPCFLVCDMYALCLTWDGSFVPCTYVLKVNYLICILLPIPSASSKIFWPCSNVSDRVQYFLNTFKFFWSWPKVIFYLINLHIWAWSKIFDHNQKILNLVQNFLSNQKHFWTSRWIRHM